MGARRDHDLDLASGYTLLHYELGPSQRREHYQQTRRGMLPDTQSTLCDITLNGGRKDMILLLRSGWRGKTLPQQIGTVVNRPEDGEDQTMCTHIIGVGTAIYL